MLAKFVKISATNSKGASPVENLVVDSPLHKKLRLKFLPIFYVLRLSDWLQGPYFYAVYATKVLSDGSTYPISLISKLFLTGFASTAIVGPWLGRFADEKGRKKGTLLFTTLYTLGALSTKSSLLTYLFAGRVLSGLGTSLLFSAPESWLVAESQKINEGDGGAELSKTFGLAYAGDSIVAIIAGYLASAAAKSRGEVGPFELSAVVLALGALGVSTFWGENFASKSSPSSDSSSVESGGEDSSSIRSALKIALADKKIALVGLMQAFFEGAMYTFVINWPPSVAAAIAKYFGKEAMVPYGGIFSCFMACCLVGSTLFQRLSSKISASDLSVGMMSLAFLSMSASAFASSLPGNPLFLLVSSFFVFEACVGCYFPLIGTLRSKIIPESHRSVIMNLFGIPLNAIVVSVFLGIKYLGVSGALGVSAGSLAVALGASTKLAGIMRKERKELEASS
ncbi:hypothetical protein TrVE_jg1647 [Triparma verrucosa]|uniref:Molybdate-anion transporter n=1 Tax=Triparma verrucosa TaxID=1606542 RepID=A0A9W7FP53_9STRA|nr:hypothetical protein TrVE_jg1647 [Triparma verrucosa]